MADVCNDLAVFQEFREALGTQDPKTIAVYLTTMRDFVAWLATQPGGTPFCVGLVTEAAIRGFRFSTLVAHIGLAIKRSPGCVGSVGGPWIRATSVAIWTCPDLGRSEEEMLAEWRADAHDDDSVEVALSARDHEETHILTVSSILLCGAFLQRRTSHLKRTDKVKICTASPKCSSLVFSPLFLFCSPLTVQHGLKRFHGF